MKKSLFRTFMAFVCIMCLFAGMTTISRAAQLPRLNLKRLDLTKSTSFTIRVYNLAEDESAVFKSTDSEVAAIDSVSEDKKSVVITGNSVGKSTISVKIKKAGKVITTLKCKVKVSPVPVSIKFSEGTITLLEGQQTYLDAIIKPYSATESPVFESSNEEVAVINVKGLVTALTPGKAVIKATLLSTGKTATCTVIVEENPEEPES
ncbi:MAG: Ig-like domain-containing protein [Eubacterium sp.]|nr:Ig-like domain-containing protein [Eubacterium sp.]